MLAARIQDSLPALKRRSMGLVALGCGAWSCLAPIAPAQTAFIPPTPFPEEKYEIGWRKNPFTLKTAPVAIQRESFSKNLALGSMYDDAAGITSVVVVNTKTRERIRLQGREPAPNGMRVEEAVIADTRGDSYAVVIMGGEKATLRYDSAYLKQMAANQGSGASPPNAATAGMAKRGQQGGPPATGAMNPDGMSPAEPAIEGLTAPPPPPPSTGGGSPLPAPPGIRPQQNQPSDGRPTIPSRRRLTVPQPTPPPASTTPVNP